MHVDLTAAFGGLRESRRVRKQKRVECRRSCFLTLRDSRARRSRASDRRRLGHASSELRELHGFMVRYVEQRSRTRFVSFVPSWLIETRMSRGGLLRPKFAAQERPDLRQRGGIHTCRRSR